MKAELSRLAELQIGYQAKGSIEDDPNGTHLIIQSRDCRDDGEISWDELFRVVPQRQAERYTLREGDVLFLAKGGRRTAVAVRDPRPHTMAVSTFYIVRMRDEDVLLPEYLAWYLNHSAREHMAAEERQGTTIPFVSLRALADLPVDLPPTGTQRRVAMLDALLRRDRRLASELLERRSRLVTIACKRAIARSEE
jgi:hypothetical protein